MYPLSTQYKHAHASALQANFFAEGSLQLWWVSICFFDFFTICQFAGQCQTSRRINLQMQRRMFADLEQEFASLCHFPEACSV
jgi:hypothetical protein